MKQIFMLLMVAIYATMFTACSKDEDKDPLNSDGNEGVVTMVTTVTKDSYRPDGDVSLYIYTFNEGDIITIDWGDGNVQEIASRFDEEAEEYEYDGIICYTVKRKYTYLKKNTYTITIKGKIKELDCYDNNLTSLDVSKCPSLTELFCEENNLTSLNISGCKALTYLVCDHNKLASLDISTNKALTHLRCYGNIFSEKAMNAIYNALPVVNQGELYCGVSNGNTYLLIGNYQIAENKGWNVEVAC